MIEDFWLYHCGWMRLPRRLFIGDAGRFELVRLPFLAAIAYHSEHGPVLIDAPFGREGPSNAGQMMGAMLKTAGLRFEPNWAVVPRLEQLGYRTSEVHHILMTHLHWDHTGGMKELAHARFHMRRIEWDHAVNQTPLEAMRSGYSLGDFRALGSRVQMLDLEEEVDLAGGFDVFGDGSVEAIPLPGHTLGHTGYRFHLRDGRRIFFVGDGAFTVSHITEDRPLGLFPRMVAHSRPMARETLRRLRKYWSETGEDADEMLVTSHDFDLLERCADGPIGLGAPSHA